MSESEVAGSDIYLQPSVLFERGKKYMVCAKSGHGKTSLLNFIYGSNRHFDGEIDYHEPVSDPFVLRRDKLSYLFQDLCLFADLTAMENVQLKNRITNHKSDDEIASLLDTLLPPEKKQQCGQSASPSNSSCSTSPSAISTTITQKPWHVSSPTK